MNQALQVLSSSVSPGLALDCDCESCVKCCSPARNCLNPSLGWKLLSDPSAALSSGQGALTLFIQMVFPCRTASGIMLKVNRGFWGVQRLHSQVLLLRISSLRELILIRLQFLALLRLTYFTRRAGGSIYRCWKCCWMSPGSCTASCGGVCLLVQL